jgi:two-component system NtrC family sensor kinase
MNQTSTLDVQQLAEEKRFIENVVNSASAPIFVIDCFHKVLFWNRSLEIMSGCSAATMNGTDLHWSAFYENKRATLADMIVDGQNECNGMYQTVYPSRYAEGGLQAEGWYSFGGQKRYLLFEAAPVRDDNGNIVAAIETLEDITSRKQTEEALLDSEARHNKIVNAAQDAIIILDPGGAISAWNDAAARIFGYSAQEVIGRNFHRHMVPERYHSEHFNAFEKFRNSGKGNAVGKVVELYAIRKNGEEFPVELALSTVQLHNQWHAIGIIRDISERKAAAEILLQTQQKLEEKHTDLKFLFGKVEQAKHEWEQTLDHISDIVILADAEHRIRRYNKLLSVVTSKQINDLVGADWRDLINDAGFRFVTFDGTSGEMFLPSTERSYDIIIYPIKNDDVVTAQVISLNDTTKLHAITQELENAYAELKEAQLQIFQQEKMASIGQLAAGVAHEINNPMGFISSNLTTLNKYIDRLTEFIAAGDQLLAGNPDAENLSSVRKRLKIDYIMEDARQLIAESQDGAGRVRRIVQDLKSFSRVDQAECALIDLNEALETTINIAWNEIKYVATLDRDFGDIPRIKCYPQQLNQVFLNLLVNAAHAIGENQGVITVRTWSEAENVFVSVADTGCGMPDEIQQRIFEPFFTTKEVGKGTGLGLSISYDIVRKHGGEISVESEIGRGSTFIVKLPTEPPTQKEESV